MAIAVMGLGSWTVVEVEFMIEAVKEEVGESKFKEEHNRGLF